MRKPFQTRPHRLANELYKGQVTVAITCCIKDKKSIITKEIVTQCTDILFNESARFECNVLAYIFMPDHCHILIQGISEKANILRAIQNFKQKSGYWLSRNYKGIEWQKSFYDHILRSEDDIDKHILYILENPVRKGICEDWREYPWKGSMIFDLNEWNSYES